MRLPIVKEKPHQHNHLNFGKINITPYDLNASATDHLRLEGNFSINATQSSGGFGDGLVDGTARNITGSAGIADLPHLTMVGDELGNRTLYIYADIPNDKGLTPGLTYNASRAWELWVE